MNILVTVNKNYLLMLQDLLYSLALYNNNLKIYLFYEQLNTKDIEELKKYIKKRKIGELFTYHISLNIKLPHNIDYISKETYFRLYAPYYLPQDMDRILFLDADIICNNSILPLYNMDFSDNILIGCDNFDGNNNLYKKRLGLPKDSHYINAGVLLINLPLYRDFITKEEIDRFIINNYDILDYQDQDVINKLFTNKIKIADCKYNYQINMILKKFGERVLTHYTTANKPWFDNYNKKRYAVDFYNFLNKIKDYDRLENLKKKHSKGQIELSIIVPIYNVEKYLPQCLNSLIEQDFSSLEIILVNDGSTDSSGEICEYYSKLDNRILTIHQSNQGLSAARNKGLSIATGKYVGFVDGDDYIDKNMYKIMYSYIKRYNVDIVTCNFYHLYDSGKIIKDKTDMSNKIYSGTKNVVIEMLNDKVIRNFVWSKLYKREIFYKIRFEENKIYEDILISLPIVEQVNNILYIQNPLYYYRHRDNSISKIKSISRIESAINNSYLRYKQINKKIKDLKIYNINSMLNRICCEYFENQDYLENNIFFEKFSIIIKEILQEYFNNYSCINKLKLDYNIDLFIKEYNKYLER